MSGLCCQLCCYWCRRGDTGAAVRFLAALFCGGVDVCDSDSDTLNGLSSSAVGIGGGRRLWASAVVVGECQWEVSVGNGSATLVLIWAAARFDICGTYAIGGGALAVSRERSLRYYSYTV